MIACLFVQDNGIYSKKKDLDLWPKERDARNYRGPFPVIAHPPCERWGRYWGGGPMLHGTEKQKLLGDDGGCFFHALFSVRTFGGIIEHPEASHAFKFFGLPIPSQSGGWTHPDRYGGRSCCVAQGNYGHESQKLTWLYGKDIDFRELKWGKTPGKKRLDEGFHSNDERSKTIQRRKRTSKKINESTPEEFADLLIDLVQKGKT